MNMSSCRAFNPGRFYPCWEIYRRDFVLLVKNDREGFVQIAKNMGGIVSAYTEMSRGGGGGGGIREGFCPYPWLSE